jgi:hypothetical protein
MVWSRTIIRNPAQRMISDSQRELVGWTGGAMRRFDIIPLPLVLKVLAGLGRIP